MSPPEKSNRRSVYVHVKRSLQLPILGQFDQADPDSPCPVRYTTTVPAQALGLLNGSFSHEQAGHMARRLEKEAPGDLRAQVARAIRLTTGRIPSPSEINADTAYAESVAASGASNWQGPSDERRARLVDRLLASPEYADYWALRWTDLLRVHREELGPRAAHAYHQWLRGMLERNVPYDQWVRELLTAEGGSETNGAVNFFRAFNNPNDLTVAVGQVFLGVRLECAK